MSSLIERIQNGTAKVGVIGLGYVGLPVAAALARAGFQVVGIDLKEERLSEIRAGRCPIDGDEPGLAELVAQVVRSGTLSATSDYAALRDADVVLIDVDTPVEADNRPKYAALCGAVECLGPVLKTGALVIVESTIAPGTIDSVVAPLLERSSGKVRNSGFLIGHCPERVMPGRLLQNLTELSRVCGGSTPEAASAMVALYRTIVKGDLDAADCVTAELVKTAENTYRDVNIAFANELAMICEASGGTFLRVRELVNKSPGRNVLLSGAGVGGHCITKDPWLLAHGAPSLEPKVIAAARSRNDGMPQHVLSLVEAGLRQAGKTAGARGARLAVLGYSYLEESDDTRNSPTAAFLLHARSAGAECVVHDPWVPAYKGDIASVVTGADAVVLLVAHQAYRNLDLKALKQQLKTPLFVDARHVYRRDQMDAAGLVFRGLGTAAVNASA
jgi:UDP-N-acetyl-D-mannosaminuronic acid dehydrogenase